MRRRQRATGEVARHRDVVATARLPYTGRGTRDPDLLALEPPCGPRSRGQRGQAAGAAQPSLSEARGQRCQRERPELASNGDAWYWTSSQGWFELIPRNRGRGGGAAWGS